MKFKRIISLALALVMLFSVAIVANAVEVTEETSSAVTNATKEGLFVHGVLGNTEETEAWQICQWNESKGAYYFYLPSGANDTQVEMYNNTNADVVVNGTTIPANATAVVNYQTNTEYTVNLGGKDNKLVFMKSNAESAVYINNANADGNGKGLWEYLSEDKSNNASATGAVVNPDGSVDNTTIKKIKGRGNTTWNKDKKPFNVTYTDRVAIGDMGKCKKFSFLANYQDSTLARNRLLYDLADAVGMPYASDSRFVDFYVDGEYKGSYQVAQKIDTGKGSLLEDIDEEDYLAEDGSVKDNFQFVCEVDASAGDEDYYFDSSSGNKITMKTPELDWGDKNYDAVLDNVQVKFDAMFTAIKNKSATLNDIVDVDSLTKIYLINELSKNWDSGVSSLYFTYKQDENGNWKFYASPVWDYDNSLGNATGVEYELNRMGLTDYEEPTGWWCKFKGAKKGGKSSSNVMFNIARNTTVLKAAPQIWFEEFVPVINAFANNTSTDKNFLSKDDYYNAIKDSAEMNYTSGWLINTGDWIADHSSLTRCYYDYKTNTYTQDTTATAYAVDTFDGEFDYMVDWMLSRTAWLSNSMYSTYTPSYVKGDVDGDGFVTIIDATNIQMYVAKYSDFTSKQKLIADYDGDGLVTIMDATNVQMVVAKLNF